MNAGPEAAGRATANRCVNGCAVDTGRSRGTRNGCERECREYRPAVGRESFMALAGEQILRVLVSFQNLVAQDCLSLGSGSGRRGRRPYPINGRMQRTIPGENPLLAATRL